MERYRSLARCCFWLWFVLGSSDTTLERDLKPGVNGEDDSNGARVGRAADKVVSTDGVDDGGASGDDGDKERFKEREPAGTGVDRGHREGGGEGCECAAVTTLGRASSRRCAGIVGT